MTPVADLFVHASVPYAGAVRWGAAVPLEGPGVYVVSTTADASAEAGLAAPPLDFAAISSLLQTRPEATVDSIAATPALIEARLRAMWPSGEPVVYIGLAGTSTRHRVNQFYRTAVGARAPHAGGWPVKMLESDSLWVHFGPTDDSAAAESAMIRHFVTHVPPDAARALTDPTAPLPFANLTSPAGRRKAHGFRGVKAPRAVADAPDSHTHTTPDPDSTPPPVVDEFAAAPSQVRLSQNVTPTDVADGQLRVPRVAKSIFPTVKGQIEVDLGGTVHIASWDPRTDGDRERSGVIRVGRGILKSYVDAGGPRRIETTPTGYRIS